MCAPETGAKRAVSGRLAPAYWALLHESELARAGGWNPAPPGEAG